MMKHSFYVYILSNSAKELQVGVTCDLEKAIHEQGIQQAKGFAKAYDYNRIVHIEEYHEANIARSREKQIQNWDASKQKELVERVNPTWSNLLYELV